MSLIRIRETFLRPVKRGMEDKHVPITYLVKMLSGTMVSVAFFVQRGTKDVPLLTVVVDNKTLQDPEIARESCEQVINLLYFKVCNLYDLNSYQLGILTLLKNSPDNTKYWVSELNADIWALSEEKLLNIESLGDYCRATLTESGKIALLMIEDLKL